MIQKYLDLVIKHPVISIAAVLVITIILVSGLPLLKFDASLDVMMPKQDQEYILNEKVKKIYGNNGNFIVMAVNTDNALDSEFLATLDRLHKDIEEYETYDKEKQQARHERYDKVTSTGSITRDNLLKAFSSDPVFQRTLKRAMKKAGTADTLDQDDINNVRQHLLVTDAVKKTMIVDMVVSPLTAKDLIGKNDTIRTFDVMKDDDQGNRIIPSTEEEMQAFEKRLTNNPSFQNGIYYRDPTTGKITGMSIVIRIVDGIDEDPFAKEVNAIAESYNLDMDLQGIPIFYEKINGYMKRDLMIFSPLVLFIVAIVFMLNFRSVRGVTLPFLTLLMADGWVLGLMGYLGYSLSVIGVALPPLMIAVGSSYSIHILNQYYIDVTGEEDQEGFREHLRSSLSHISHTVMLAGITTFTGFFMLITNQVSAIRIWGVFSAVGILFAVFISLTFIPAGLTLFSRFKEKRQKTQRSSSTPVMDYIIKKIIWVTSNHHGKVLAVSVMIIALAIAGTLQLRAETSIFSYFHEDDPILSASRKIGKKYGGAYGLNILINTGKKNGVKDPEFLKFTEKFRTWLLAEENSDLNIGRTDSFGDFMKSMNLAMHNNDHRYFAIPDKKIDLLSYIDMFTGEDDNDDGRIDDLESYIDRYYTTINIFARMWERQGHLLSSTDMSHTVDRIEEYLEKNLPPGCTYQTSGEPKIIVRLSYHVITGQLMSLLFSLAVVFIIVFILYRKLSYALLSLIPITFAVLVNFGVMGWTGIRLDLATAIIASITIGIGIDDTIHFINTYRKNLNLGLDRDRALAETLSVSGRAIIYTSLALIFGFLVFVFSSFRPIYYFGMLVALTMVATTTGALLVLPSVIRLANVSSRAARNATTEN